MRYFTFIGAVFDIWSVFKQIECVTWDRPHLNAQLLHVARGSLVGQRRSRAALLGGGQVGWEERVVCKIAEVQGEQSKTGRGLVTPGDTWGEAVFLGLSSGKVCG